MLERPDIPLHHNAAEEGWRDRVKKRKVSADTYSERGRACRDPFASLKKTGLKLKVPFSEYRRDRIFKRNTLPPLPDLIRAKALASGASPRTGLLRAYSVFRWGKRARNDQLTVKCHVPRGGPLGLEHGSSIFLAFSSKMMTQFRRTRQPVKRRSERLRIGRRHQKPSHFVLDKSRDATNPSGNNRTAHPHRFDNTPRPGIT